MAGDLSNSPFFTVEGALQVRRAPGDAVPVALVEGRLPARAEVNEVVARGYALQVNTSISKSEGEGLRPWLSQITALTLIGAKLELGWLRDLDSLVALHVMGVVTEATGVATLAGLERYAGVLAGMEGVMFAPRLDRVELYDVREGKLPSLAPRLRYVKLTDVGKDFFLRAGDGEPQLRHFSLVGARDFRADCLAQFPLLERLELDEVRCAHGLDVLATLPNLRELHLSSCRDLGPLAFLTRLEHVQVHVWGRDAAAKQLRALPGASSWTFH